MADKTTQSIITRVGGIAADCGASAIFVYADALSGERLPLPESWRDSVYYVSRTQLEQEAQEERGQRYIRVPNVFLTRMGQVKIALFIALIRDQIHHDDVVIFLSGLAGSGSLDTLMVVEVSKEFEMFRAETAARALPAETHPEVVVRVVDLASELGQEGREGKPVGSLFVVGDTERVLPMTRQLILNPFRGYPESDRNVLDVAMEETVKELSTLDGAFVVRGDGVIESCGSHIRVSGTGEDGQMQGLGARHHAAAAITEVTDAISVTVSESTGTVTVFRNGRILTEIQKPRGARGMR